MNSHFVSIIIITITIIVIVSISSVDRDAMAFKDEAVKLRNEYRDILAQRDNQIKTLEDEIQEQKQNISQLMLDVNASSVSIFVCCSTIRHGPIVCVCVCVCVIESCR